MKEALPVDNTNLCTSYPRCSHPAGEEPYSNMAIRLVPPNGTELRMRPPLWVNENDELASFGSTPIAQYRREWNDRREMLKDTPLSTPTERMSCAMPR
jgi:hypothetical protein